MRVESLATEIHELVLRVKSDYSGVGVESIDDTKAAAAYVTFVAIADYFASLRAVLAEGQHLGAGALLRAQLEAWSDLRHIFKDDNKVESRSKAYIGALDTFRDAMKGVDDESLDSQARILRQVNANWTSSSIEDRVNGMGYGIMLTTYDILSYYAHPNPATAVLSLKDSSVSSMNNDFFLASSVRIMIDTLLTLLKWGRDISVKPSDIHLVAAMYLDVIIPDPDNGISDKVQEEVG